MLTGNLKVQNFVFGGFPFGDITSARVRFVPLVLELFDVQAKKGKSDYSVSNGRLNFDGPAPIVTDAHVKSTNFDLRDFFNIWHFETDPRFDDIWPAKPRSTRTVHYVLGGPEDRCGGGNLRVAGSARFGALDLFDERYDSGNAEFDFRWSDRDATYQGVDLSVPSLTLRKGTGTIVGSFGLRQGAQVYGHFVGSAVPLSHLDALAHVAARRRRPAERDGGSGRHARRAHARRQRSNLPAARRSRDTAGLQVRPAPGARRSPAEGGRHDSLWQADRRAVRSRRLRRRPK